jgi:hypothetical protein
MRKERPKMEKGAIFNIGSTDKGDWFDFFESEVDLTTGEITYFPPKAGTGRACFRSAKDLLTEQISKRKKEAEFVLNPKTRSMERVEYFALQDQKLEQKEADDRIDYMITGLEKFFDGAGKPIKCTRENKLLLSKVPMFDRYMARCIELQLNLHTEHAEGVEKNLSKP